MGKYADLLNNKEVQKKAKELTTSIFKFSPENPVLVGKLLSYEDFTGSEYDTTCKKYLFDTDNGRVTCVLGASHDTSLAIKENIDNIFIIEHKGKEVLKNGRAWNNFRIVQMCDIPDHKAKQA